MAVLENSGKDFEIIKYIANIPSVEELKQIIEYLSIEPIELVRKNESIWKEKYKGKKLSNDEILSAMVKYPNLIERPIVVKGNKAVIGRPAEKIEELLD